MCPDSQPFLRVQILPSAFGTTGFFSFSMSPIASSPFPEASLGLSPIFSRAAGSPGLRASRYLTPLGPGLVYLVGFVTRTTPRRQKPPLSSSPSYLRHLAQCLTHTQSQPALGRMND